jgi:RNA-dependent RNA polymerase
LLTDYFPRFCTCLDGLKSGLRVRPEVLEQDKKQFTKRLPYWKETEEGAVRAEQRGDNDQPVQRPSNLGRFVMDAIKTAGKKEKVRSILPVCVWAAHCQAALVLP